LPIPTSAEAFQWVGDLLPEEREGRFFIRGRAIHPCKTYHPHEWPQIRVYLEEELIKSAPSLTDKPLLIDHTTELEPPNKVLQSAWEDGAVEYVAEVNKPIYELVKSGEIQHVSIEYDWHVLEKLNGVAPRGLELTGLSLLRRMQPGDPATSAEVWEGIVNKLKEMKKLSESTLEERVKNLEGLVKRFTEQEEQRERLHKEQQQRAEKYGIQPKQGGNLTKPSEYEKIPEDQFADPVNWKYPIDAGHADAALKYFNQPDNRGEYNPEEQAKILAKIIGAALANNIEVAYQPNDPLYKALPEDLKAKLKGYENPKTEEAKALEEAQRTIVDLTKQRDELKARLDKLNMGEGVLQPGAKPPVLPGYVKAEEILAILPKQVPYWWGAGPHELIRRLRSKCSQSN
jgi:hypothetical protein